MTTPTLEDRVTILETRFDTILPTLATKSDIARLEGRVNNLETKMDAMGNRLLLRFGGIAFTLAAVAVAAARYL